MYHFSLDSKIFTMHLFADAYDRKGKDKVFEEVFKPYHQSLALWWCERSAKDKDAE